MTTTVPPALTAFLTADHRQLWDEVDTFGAEEVAPRVAGMEAAPDVVEREIADLMAGQRWFALTVPKRYGGLAAGQVAKTVVIHRLARVSAASAAILQATHIPVGALMSFATHEQKARWLPPVADGSGLLTIAATEPEAGGHIGGIETTAVHDGDDWVLTGSKVHVGNSHIARGHLVIARTAPVGVRTSQALTAFLVDADSEGLTVQPHRPAIGLRGFSAGRLDLAHVRVRKENIIGKVGQGMDVSQSSSILYGRPNLAAVSLGVHETLAELTDRYLQNRQRYSGSLADIPAVHQRIGAVESRVRAARDLAYLAVHLLDRGIACDPELINSKLLGHRYAARSAQDAMELHGARGLDGTGLLQRLWRDIQCTYAPAGTGMIQLLRLADTALGTAPVQWSERLAATTAWARSDSDLDPTPA
ncbi:acyl-CoA dehydrogenase family protein [Streptomyces sp. NPDC046860]|uniref:acyl-CoA dehydrogenase family protein n=1 Tax=Streptomyces sp. NPDC046860 TaxID=3154495 RepID=UPI003408F8BC